MKNVTSWSVFQNPVTYFVRWTNDWLFLFSIVCMYVPCTVKMFYLLTEACQYMVLSILVCAIVPGFHKSGHTQTHRCF